MPLISKKITAIWALLLLATALSVETVDGGILGGGHRLATMAVVVIAFVKVRFIGLDFMELRAAPLPLRAVFEAWIVVVCAAILVIYAVGPP